MAGETPIPSENLIERANVPELEVITLQQQLNARIRAGLLSGPLLPENGKLCAATQKKQREQEAVDAIALAKIEPKKPADPAAHAEARAEDERVLAFVREEFAHVGDQTYMDFDHKAPVRERIRKLEAAFRRKWELSGQALEAIEAVTREVIRPGSLLLADGVFDYERLNEKLAGLKRIEAALATVPRGDDDYASLEDRVVVYRQSIVTGLQHDAAGPAPARPKPAPVPTAEPAAAPPAAAPRVPRPQRPDPAPAPPPARPEPARVFVPDPERERQGRELDMMGPERRLQQLKERPDDPLAPQIAASLARTHPDAFGPEVAARLDAYAMADLARDEARLARVPPKARLAIVKAAAQRPPAGDEEEAAAFAGAIAATLLRQHPNAAGEVIGNAPGESKARLTLAMLERLNDDELAKLPREALHACYKEIQSTGTSDGRRHMARLVRLMNKR